MVQADTINTNLGAEGDELGELLVVVLVEDVHVLGVADEPVDGGEVLALGQLLVKTPEHLDDTKGGRGHRVGEVTTRGRHGTDNAHRALTAGSSCGK
jgi:hypothetical protein